MREFDRWRRGAGARYNNKTNQNEDREVIRKTTKKTGRCGKGAEAEVAETQPKNKPRQQCEQTRQAVADVEAEEGMRRRERAAAAESEERHTGRRGRDKGLSGQMCVCKNWKGRRGGGWKIKAKQLREVHGHEHQKKKEWSTEDLTCVSAEGVVGGRERPALVRLHKWKDAAALLWAAAWLANPRPSHCDHLPRTTITTTKKRDEAHTLGTTVF